MFDTGLRKTNRTHAKVISVGGLMAGGSGKTPVTLDIVRWLVYKLIPLDEWKEGEYPVVMVSRGYRRKSSGVRVVCDGTRVVTSADKGGDEPVMMANALLHDHRRKVFGVTRGVPVIVAEDRVAGVEEAERRFGAKVVVLDDAFSHRLIARDLDILIINEDLPDWWWRPLPAGRMRESFNSIRRADFIVYSGRKRNPVLRHRIGELLGDHDRSATVYVETDNCTVHGGPKAGQKASLLGKRVVLATGIARPKRFFTSIHNKSVSVIDTFAFPDHAPWTLAQRERVQRRARQLGADAIVITAKDAVKWPDEEFVPPVLVTDVLLRWSPERPHQEHASLEPPPPAANPELLELVRQVWESAGK